MSLVMSLRAAAKTSSSTICRAFVQQAYGQSQRFAYSTGTRVIDITDEEHYEKEIKGFAGLAVVDFTAKWCGPCKQVAPHFDALSVQHADVKFLKVDIDNEDVGAVVNAANVSAVPTFDFVKDGVSKHQIQGANLQALQAKIAELSQ
eukprot:CAMPEP_0118933444 /NCGR_PEP_ID=MMETSP1169-20130426/11991_1 /TAXON_ID=36882 /ORGANISM="Pyramimonas obovata, Strain CCMP722" /LENGTH=146 /DNA_ID=CAMNT_0006876203 /DNA_START=44 /DNA_END=487 /DNA_ORIENTATION=-